MRFLVDFCYLMTALLIAPIILYRSWRTGKYRSDWQQRRGFLPELPPSNRRVWVHAVSVGEVNAVRGIIDAWRKKAPDVEFVLSTTTDTGQARARQLFPDLLIVRYPLDFSWFVRRALDRIKPNMIVLVELELWYQFVTTAAQRNIPIAVVNGRLSERSVQRFSKVLAVTRRMFEPITWVGVQDADYAERFKRMGTPADRVEITKSVKWDGAQVADSIDGADALAREMGLRTDQPILVAGSTGPGEEEILLNACRSLQSRWPQLQWVLVPRKPERFDEVAELIARMGFACIRRSRRTGTLSSCSETLSNASTPIFLGDTMGELRKFYSLATMVFVGRSLAKMGGSDTMEVAALAKPIVVGPHNENFADATARLHEQQAIRILSADINSSRAADELAAVIDDWLQNPTAAATMGQRGRQVVLANRGATQRTVDWLAEILDNRCKNSRS